MRYRSRTTSEFDVPYDRVQTDYACDGSVTGISHSPSLGGRYEFKEISDVEVPRFQSLLKCGKFLPLNPCVINTVVVDLIPFDGDNIRRYRTGCTGHVSRTVIGPKAIPADSTILVEIPSVPDEVCQAMVNQAVARARTATWDVLTDFAEAEKTIAMFVNAVNRVKAVGIRAAVKAVRRSRKKKVDEVVRDFGNLWLEYRYGWMPAIFSLQSAVEAFNKRNPPPFEKGRSSTTLQHNLSKVWNGSETGTEWTRTQIVTVEQTVRGWAAAEMAFQSNFGFDPIRTAWEVTPFSFVVDWLVDIGSWIESWSPFSPGRTLGSCLSLKQTIELSTSVDWRAVDASSSFGSGAWSGTLAVRREEKYTRLPYQPSLPGWNPRLTTPRLLDAIALAMGIRPAVLTRLRF